MMGKLFTLNKALIFLAAFSFGTSSLSQNTYAAPPQCLATALRAILNQDGVVLTSNTVVIDSNVAIAFEKHYQRRLMNPYEQASFRWAQTNPFDTYLIAEQTIAETFPGGLESTLPFKVGKIKLEVSREDPSYQFIFSLLKRNNVGGHEGQADCTIVTDLFFAQTGTPDVIPTLATADRGIYTALMKMSGMDPMRVFGSAKPVESFLVTVVDRTGKRRTIKVIPIRPVKPQ